jgi:hypothetical protein
MSHCIIQNSPTGGLIATGSNWYVDSSIIRDSNGDGINASGGLNISGCSILNSNGYGINITYSSGTSVTGNVITNSASYPLRFPAGYLQNLYLNSNSYPINGVNKIMVFGKGTISSSFTVRDDGIPYTIDSMLYVGTHGAPLPVLTIEPGVEVQFAPGAGMLFAWSVGGYGQWGLLNAKGTPEQHIIFKSVVEPAQGWSGINLGEQSGDTLEYVDISNGYVSSWHGTHYMSHCIIQNSPSHAVISTGSNWNIINCSLINNTTSGFYGSGNITIGNDLNSTCDIYGNAGFNIQNTAGTSINARYNYWGITDSTIIASKISGNVNWIPWADYSFRDNLGTLSGYIVDSDNSNPISEALVAITQPFQREVYTDVSGHYIIRDIPANTPFTLIVSATNYIDRTITGITVPKGQTNNYPNILLTYDLTGNYELVEFTPSPNPQTSQVMQGGTIHRYYQVRNINTGVGKARVPVQLSNGNIYYSSLNGLLDISIPSDQIGNGLPGPDYEFRIIKVNNIDIPLGQQQAFNCSVRELQHFRRWKVDWSSQMGALGVRGSVGSSGTLTLVDRLSSIPGAEFIELNRANRGSLGISPPGMDIPPSVHIEGAQVSGGAGIGLSAGVDFIKGFGDGVQFYYTSPNNSEIIVESMLMLSALTRNLSSNASPILAGIYDYYLSQNYRDILEPHYQFEGFAGVKSGVQFTADLGVNSSTNYSFGMNMGLGASAEAMSKCKYLNETQEIYRSIALSATARFTGAGPGIRITQNHNNPYHYSLEKNFLPYTFNDAQVSIEPGYVKNAATNQIDRFFLKRDVRLVQGMSGQERTYTYNMEGSQVNQLMSALGPLGQFISEDFSNGFQLNILNTSLWDFCANLFNQAGNIQAIDPGNFRTNFDEEVTDISDVFDFSFKIKGLTLSFGSSVKYERNDGYTSRKGVTITGNFGEGVQTRDFELETYPEPEQIQDDLIDVIRNTLFRLDDALWNSFLTSKYLSFLDRRAKPGAILSDSIFNISDNGSYIQYDPTDFPPDLDTLAIYSWGWYGASPRIKMTALNAKSLELRENLKTERQQMANLKYGIGGTYQFEPQGLALLNPITLVIHYDDAEITDFLENDLKIYYEKPITHNWVLVGGEIDTVNNTVTVQIDSLRTFTLAPKVPASMITMNAFPVAILADSMMQTTISSALILNNDSTAVTDGTIFTISTDLGMITTADLDTSLEGVQIASFDGRILFILKSGIIPGFATISASSKEGSATGSLQIEFIDNGAPGIPTGVTAIGRDENILISWNPSEAPDIAGYKIFFDTDDSLPPYDGTTTIYGLISPVSVGSVDHYVLEGLLNDSTYYISIKAFDIQGNESDYSMALAIKPGIPCKFMLGDINSDGQRIGGDVTYGVRYFKALGPQPPDSCYMDSTHAYLYVAGDVNGNCEFRGSDITRLVAYFKGNAALAYCHFFPTTPRVTNESQPIEPMPDIIGSPQPQPVVSPPIIKSNEAKSDSICQPIKSPIKTQKGLIRR